jgi:putative endonuclease
MKGKRGVGAQGERQAAEFLQKLGYELIDQNFFTRTGELDLICRDGEHLVFIEVKLRNSSKYGSALESCTPKKLARVVTAAEEWLTKNDLAQSNWRIDLIAIQNGKIEHFKNFGS